MPSRHVHLIGSVPMADARTVFKTVSAALGPRLRWIPDGETGARIDWVMSFEPIFASHPALELSPDGFQLHATARKNRRYRLKPGKPFRRYGLEQQAELVASRFLADRGAAVADAPPRNLLPFA